MEVFETFCLGGGRKKFKLKEENKFNNNMTGS